MASTNLTKDRLTKGHVRKRHKAVRKSTTKSKKHSNGHGRSGVQDAQMSEKDSAKLSTAATTRSGSSTYNTGHGDFCFGILTEYWKWIRELEEETLRPNHGQRTVKQSLPKASQVSIGML
jgi:hypothetical protein